jgi:hypothetical protein
MGRRRGACFVEFPGTGIREGDLSASIPNGRYPSASPRHLTSNECVGWYGRLHPISKEYLLCCAPSSNQTEPALGARSGSKAKDKEKRRKASAAQHAEYFKPSDHLVASPREILEFVGQLTEVHKDRIWFHITSAIKGLEPLSYGKMEKRRQDEGSAFNIRRIQSVVYRGELEFTVWSVADGGKINWNE